MWNGLLETKVPIMKCLFSRTGCIVLGLEWVGMSGPVYPFIFTVGLLVYGLLSEILQISKHPKPVVISSEVSALTSIQ